MKLKLKSEKKRCKVKCDCPSPGCQLRRERWKVMWLSKVAKPINTVVSPVVNVIGKIGAGVIAVMMLLVVADVVGRRVFNRPVPGTLELVQYLFIIVVFFAIVYCELLRRHIIVDVVVARLGQRARNGLNSVIYIFFLGISCLLTWQFVLYLGEVWQSGMRSAVLRVPAVPFTALATLGSALFSLMILTHLLQLIVGGSRNGRN